VNHEERIRQLLGQKEPVQPEDLDRGCLPAVFYLLAVVFLGLVVEFCAHK